MGWYQRRVHGDTKFNQCKKQSRRMDFLNMDKVTESQKISYTLGVFELPTSVLYDTSEALRKISGFVERMDRELNKMIGDGRLNAQGTDTIAEIRNHVRYMNLTLHPTLPPKEIITLKDIGGHVKDLFFLLREIMPEESNLLKLLKSVDDEIMPYKERLLRWGNGINLFFEWN